MSADQRDLREHVALKALAADFRALRDEYGDDLGIPNDDGTWMLESDISAKQRDKSRARRFRDLATIAAGAAGIASGAHAFDAWLMRLRDQPCYVAVEVVVTQEDRTVITQSGWLNDVIDASIGLCGTLEADAVVSVHAPFGVVVPVPTDAAWAQTAAGRQTRATSFLQTLTESGLLTGQVRIHPKANELPLRADERLIWDAARFATSTAWWRWKTHKHPQNTVADGHFRRLLNMKPSEFMQAWTMSPKRTRRV